MRSSLQLSRRVLRFRSIHTTSKSFEAHLAQAIKETSTPDPSFEFAKKIALEAATLFPSEANGELVRHREVAKKELTKARYDDSSLVGLTGGQIFSELLRQHGIKHVFGYPGNFQHFATSCLYICTRLNLLNSKCFRVFH